MKNLNSRILVMILCATAFAFVGRAFPGDRAHYQVPFAFTVKNQVFPAGKYTVERLNPTNPDILILKSADGTAKTIVQVQRIVSEHGRGQSQMTFSRETGAYVLTEIWGAGEKYGFRIL